MIYVRWDKDEIADLNKLGLSHVVTECLEDGSVRREIGFDNSGGAVHRAPDTATKFFLFDLQVVNLAGLTTCMSATEFHNLWQSMRFPPNQNNQPTR